MGAGGVGWVGQGGVGGVGRTGRGGLGEAGAGRDWEGWSLGCSGSTESWIRP